MQRVYRTCMALVISLQVKRTSACGCEDAGSQNGACDVLTGQCPCLPLVATMVDVDVVGNTGVKQCASCLADHYGYGSPTGCSNCLCNPAGSNGTQCTPDGQCPCKDTISGLQCDICADTYYSFNADGCSPCECDPRGSTALTCDIGNGFCPCKDNVVGDKCSICKPSFFGLADYNPRGCQPCFCFGHGTLCNSADGFRTANVTSTTTFSGPAGLTDAGDDFLGDKRSSYGLRITWNLDFPSSIDLTLIPLVIIEGAGSRIVYTEIPPSIVGNNVYAVRLFPENWMTDASVNPTSDQMYRILANITKFAFNTNLNGTIVSLGSVFMETTEAADGMTADTGASSVEQCTCDSGKAVTGLSCDVCTTGFRRVDLTLPDIRYGACTTCDCSFRTVDPTPDCDEITAVCLNCRNGSIGDSCELCASNVTVPNCDTCDDNYWGLGADGCRECACSEVGSFSPICDKTTGNCPCKPNVEGRQCDVCIENFHNLTAAGCIECTRCYTKVEEEAFRLREMIANMTGIIAQLRAADNTGVLGLFLERLTAAQQSQAELLTFLSTASAQETQVLGQIDGYNTTIQDLTADLAQARADLDTTMADLFQSEQNMQSSQDTMQLTTLNMVSTNTELGPLQDIQTQLQDLLNSLTEVDTYLRTVTSDSTSVIDGILAAVDEIEVKSRDALTLVQTDQEASRVEFERHKTNTNNIVSIENLDLTLGAQSASAAMEAERIGTETSELSSDATTLVADQGIISMSLNVNFGSINNSLTVSRNMLNNTKNLALAGRVDVEAKRDVVNTAIANSELQRMKTTELITQCDNLNERLVNAEVKAEDAKALEMKVFEDANFMLDTMMNFPAKALDVEQRANVSLQQANTVTAESEQVIADAEALMTSLAPAQQASSDAKERARQAKTTAETKNADISVVAASAESLRTNMTSDIAGFQAKSIQPITINNTLVADAQGRCAIAQSDITGTDASIATVTEASDQVNAQLSASQISAGAVLDEINRLPTIDVQRIAELSQEVATLSALFSETELRTMIQTLQAQYQAQLQWLNEKKAKKANMQATIERLKQTRQSLEFGNP